MSRRQKFRTNAGECLQLAEAMKSPEVRAMLIAMAHAWHRLAQEFDHVKEGHRGPCPAGQTA
jgi:hypothetical protein